MRLSTSSTATVGLFALLVATSNVQAADRFAMTCLENKTNLTIRYQGHWGSGDWKSFSLGAGQRRPHIWDLGKTGKNPPFRIKFDDDLSSRYKQRDYVLESYAAPQQTDCVRYGREYQFRFDGTAKNYIDVVSIR